MGLALILMYVALNLLSPGEMFPSVAPYRPILILAVVSLPVLVLERLRAPEVGKLRTQFVLVILFYGFALCSWLPHGWLRGVLVPLTELTPNILVYFLGVVLLRSQVRLQSVRVALVLVAIFVMVNACWELPYARSSGATTPYVLTGHILSDEENARIRGLGMLNDPNVFGQFLLMILPMLYVSKRDTGLGPGYLFAVPLTVLFLFGVYLTGSRGAEMGVAALVGLFLTRRLKTAGAAISAVIGGLLLLAVNAFRSRTISLSNGMDRLAIWSDGMQFFKRSPVWGIGYAGFGEKSVMTAHNSFLLCAAELGMLGYFLWMSILVVTMIQLNRVPKVVGKSNPPLARWAVALRISLSVYLLTSFFLSRAYELPLFLLLGMSGAVICASGGDEAIPLRGAGWPVWSLALCGGILTLIYVMLRLRMV